MAITANPPIELQQARNAVVDLVDSVRGAVQSLYGSNGFDSSLWLTSSWQPRLDSALDSVHEKRRIASEKVAAVGSELIVASNTSQSAHAQVIEFACMFLQVAGAWKASVAQPEPNTVQKWLAHTSHELERFERGIVRNTRLGSRPASGIDFELNRAVAIRGAKNPEQLRLRCEATTRSFWLDHKPLASDLDGVVFAYLCVLVENSPNPIPFSAIQTHVPILAGENQVRFKRKVEKLPFSIRHLITRTSKGHALKPPA